MLSRGKGSAEVYFVTNVYFSIDYVFVGIDLAILGWKKYRFLFLNSSSVHVYCMSRSVTILAQVSPTWSRHAVNPTAKFPFVVPEADFAHFSMQIRCLVCRALLSRRNLKVKHSNGPIILFVPRIFTPVLSTEEKRGD